MLTEEIRQLASRVGELEDSVATISKQVASAGTRGSQEVPQEGMPCDPCLADVLGITHEMFPGKAEVELVADPEDPAHSFVLFTVSATGNPQEIVGKYLEWHRRVARLTPGDSGRFCLSINPA